LATSNGQQPYNCHKKIQIAAIETGHTQWQTNKYHMLMADMQSAAIDHKLEASLHAGGASFDARAARHESLLHEVKARDWSPSGLARQKRTTQEELKRGQSICERG
jgi:hypothetical protein